jgi:hypothetical protein
MRGKFQVKREEHTNWNYHEKPMVFWRVQYPIEKRNEYSGDAACFIPTRNYARIICKALNEYERKRKGK